MRQIEMFHAVMSTGTISAAARRVGVSQPSASGMLRHMEDRLGVRLFSRDGGRLNPTPEALALFEEAEKAVQVIDLVRERAAALRTGLPEILRLGASPNLSIGIVPRLVKALRERFPILDIRIDLLAPRPLQRALTEGRLDLGFTMAGPDDPGLSIKKLGEIGIVCAMPLDDSLAAHHAIEPADLKDREMIAHSHDLEERRIVDAIFAAHGVVPRSAIRVQSSQSAVRLVEAGLGIALIDAFTADPRAFDTIAIRPFRPTTTLDLAAVWPMVRPLGRVGEMTIRLMQTELSDASHLPIVFSSHNGAPEGYDTGSTAP